MISNIQNKAREIFSKKGYPKTTNEDWKYTNTKNFTSCTSHNQKSNYSPSDFLSEDATNIILFNGQISHKINKNTLGLQILSYEDIKSSNDCVGKFLELSDYNTSGVIAHNTSEFKDAIHITINSDYDSKRPINIISVTENLEDNKIIFPRIYIHAKSNSNSKFFIQHINNNSSGLINSVSEFYCEESANIEIIHLSDIKNQELIDSIIFNQGDNSKIKFLSVAFGGYLYRSNIDIDINGENCDNQFGVLILGSNKNHIDYHTNINHQAGHSLSSFECRSMLRDSANGIFNGKILVSQGASGTNATLNNNNLLLSDKSEMQSNPQLEINCEDVKCSHGSTSGNIDKDALFYLQSRGINALEAKQILVEGFINKLLSSFDYQFLSLDKKVKEWIQA